MDKLKLKQIIKEELSKLREDETFDKENMISNFYNAKVSKLNQQIKGLVYAQKMASSIVGYVEEQLRNGVHTPTSVKVVKNQDEENVVSVIAMYAVDNYSDSAYDQLEGLAYSIVEKARKSSNGFVDVDGGANDRVPTVQINIDLDVQIGNDMY